VIDRQEIQILNREYKWRNTNGEIQMTKIQIYVSGISLGREAYLPGTQAR